MKKYVEGIRILLMLVFLSACSPNVDYKVEDIQQVQLAITGGPIENYFYTLEEEGNIKEALRVAKQLETYKSPAISTWSVDISYNIIYKNGKKETLVYKDIRPYDELLEKVLESKEVREQDLDLYGLSATKINTLTLIPETKEPIVIERETDKELLESLIENLKNYYLSDAYLDKEVVSNPSCTIEVVLERTEESLDSYYIFSNNEEAIALLKDKGLYEQLVVTPEDIEAMFLQKGDKRITIEDKVVMQTVLDYYQSFHNNESVIDVEYTLKETTGHHLTQYGSLLKDKIPQEIEVLFNQ